MRKPALAILITALLLTATVASAQLDKPPADDTLPEDPPALYTYAVTREPAAWETDIGLAQSFISNCDDCADRLDFPWTFRFYGYDYTSIFASSNGLMTFGSPDTQYQDSTAGIQVRNGIFPLWDDWSTLGDGAVHYKTYPDRAVVTWLVPHHPATQFAAYVAEFQAVLYRNGVIRFNYRTNNHPAGTTTASLGISTADPPNAHVYGASETDLMDSYVFTPALEETIPPVSTISLSGAQGNNNWYTTAVQAILSAVDNAGGIGVDVIEYNTNGIAGPWLDYAGPFLLESAGTTTVLYHAVDFLGNIEADKSATVRIDRTAPTTTGSIVEAPNELGWHTIAPTARFFCEDATSGPVQSTFDIIVTQEGAGLSVPGTCEDLAGLTSSSTITGVNVDTSPPLIDAVATPALNADGWANQPVTVHFACQDAQSGIAFCSPDVVIGDEGQGQLALGSAANNAGLVSEAGLGVSIDFLPPFSTISHAGAPDIAPGEYRGIVTVDILGEDGVSGVRSIEYSLDNGPWTPYTAPFPVEALGPHTVQARSTDYADNAESPPASDSFTIVHADLDHDGFLDDEECNDADPTTYPTAPDAVCNGIDNNCNGQLDEGFVATPTSCGEGVCTSMGATTCTAGVLGDTCVPGPPGTFYADADGDGFGDPSSVTQSCFPLAGSADNTLDCDDADPAINPNAEDAVCDGIDNNCNGQLDEGFVPTPTSCGTGVCAATGQTTCTEGVLGDTCVAAEEVTVYTDGDGDGSPGTPLLTCNPADGSPELLDCNDADPLINPGAADALCDGIDNNCNGQLDEGYVPHTCGVGTCQAASTCALGVESCVEPPAATVYADADGDGYGNPAAPLTTCEPGAGYVFDNTDCDDADPAKNPGGTDVCAPDNSVVNNNCNAADDAELDCQQFCGDRDHDNYIDDRLVEWECSLANILDCVRSSYCPWVVGDGDCDEGNAATYPGAPEEWGAGTDNNCDGLFCGIKTDYSEGSKCSGTFVAHNAAELAAYATNFGLENGKYKNLEVAFPLTGAEVAIHSPCKVEIEDAPINAGLVCVDGRLGVEAEADVTATRAAFLSELGSAEVGERSSISASELRIQGKKEAELDQRTTATISGPLSIIATGEKAKAIIDHRSTVTAGTLVLEGANAIVGTQASVSVAGAATVRSTGESQGSKAWFKASADVTAQSLSLTSTKTAILGPHTVTTTSGNFHMDAPRCRISNSASVAAGSRSGSCLSGTPTAPDATLTITVTDVQNTGAGADMTNAVYAGAALAGTGTVVVPLTDANGFIEDPSNFVDVPGLHVQRGVDEKNGPWVRITAYGFNKKTSREVVEASLHFEGVTVSGAKSHGNWPYEHQGDGVCTKGSPGQDEYVITPGQADGTLCSTTDVSADSVTIYLGEYGTGEDDEDD